MNIEKVMQQIRNKNLTDRDLVIDDLFDAINGSRIEEPASARIVIELIEIARHETNGDAHESLMRILSMYYEPFGECSSEIEAFVIKGLGTFAKDSLLHALCIIADSSTKNRNDILAFYAQSDNEVVRESAIEYLNEE